MIQRSRCIEGMAPARSVASTSASIQFNSSEQNVTFNCKLDSGTYASCTSPYVLTSLAQGAHSVQVYAVDQAGNADSTPLVVSWIADTLAPDTNITSAEPTLLAPAQ